MSFARPHMQIGTAGSLLPAFPHACASAMDGASFFRFAYLENGDAIRDGANGVLWGEDMTGSAGERAGIQQTETSRLT